MKLGCAMLFVDDLGRMIDFFSETMGLHLVEESRSDDWAEFDTGTTRFALHAIPHHLKSASRPTEPARARDEAAAKLIFDVENIDEELKRLSSLGVTLIHRPWGGRDVLDPEGNVIGLRARSR